MRKEDNIVLHLRGKRNPYNAHFKMNKKSIEACKVSCPDARYTKIFSEIVFK